MALLLHSGAPVVQVTSFLWPCVQSSASSSVLYSLQLPVHAPQQAAKGIVSFGIFSRAVRNAGQIVVPILPAGGPTLHRQHPVFPRTAFHPARRKSCGPASPAACRSAENTGTLVPRREIVSFGLPQRHIVMVHNPAYLNDSAVAEAIEEGDARMLTIAPHVGEYAAEILAEHGAQVSLAWAALPTVTAVEPSRVGSRSGPYHVYRPSDDLVQSGWLHRVRHGQNWQGRNLGTRPTPSWSSRLLSHWHHQPRSPHCR